MQRSMDTLKYEINFRNGQSTWHSPNEEKQYENTFHRRKYFYLFLRFHTKLTNSNWLVLREHEESK